MTNALTTLTRTLAAKLDMGDGADLMRVLGKALPTGAEVHHVNENRADNRHENLVVCPNKAYHKLLHVRMAAMDACGNPNFRKCPFCKEYDSPERMKHNPSSRYYYHAACKQEYRKARSAQA